MGKRVAILTGSRIESGRRDRLRQQRRAEMRQHGAVLGAGIERHYRAQRAGTRHILRDDRGRARDVPPEVTLDEAGIGIGAATRRQTDQDPERLAGVKGLDVLRFTTRRHGNDRQHEGRNHQPAGHQRSHHGISTRCVRSLRAP